MTGRRDFFRARTQTPSWYAERLGWLNEFAADVEGYREWLAAEEALAEGVRGGLSRGRAARFWQGWKSRAHAGGWRVERYAWELRGRLMEEGQAVPLGRRVLGSSDVIESLFGKYKGLVAGTPGGEVGPNVLLLPLPTVRLRSGMPTATTS